VSGFAGGPNFSFQGMDFAVAGTGGSLGNVTPQMACHPCATGDVISINGQFPGSALGVGAAKINGVFFPNPLGFGGTITFTGTPFVVPFGSGIVTITQIPFTFSGHLLGCPVSCANNPAVFTVDLTGSGFAELELLSTEVNSEGTPLFVFRSITYNFGIPEPMSVVLLGTGLTALSVSIRRIRQR
jgi:hypothetical protein